MVNWIHKQISWQMFYSERSSPRVSGRVYLPRSAELMVSLLGILKAGGAYVVLDPLYPKSRLEYMIEDAGIQFVVTAEG